MDKCSIYSVSNFGSFGIPSLVSHMVLVVGGLGSLPFPWDWAGVLTKALGRCIGPVVEFLS